MCRQVHLFFSDSAAIAYHIQHVALCSYVSLVMEQHPHDICITFLCSQEERRCILQKGTCINQSTSNAAWFHEWVKAHLTALRDTKCAKCISQQLMYAVFVASWVNVAYSRAVY